MDGVRIDFPNAKARPAALRELPEDTRGEILASALVEGAEPIKDAAQQRASIHRGPRRRPEAVPLADTIKTNVEKIGKDEASVDVGTKSPIAHLVEFGHAEVRGDTQIGIVPAYPFLRNSADEQAEEAVRIIGETLGAQIEKAFRARAPHETT